MTHSNRIQSLNRGIEILRLVSNSDNGISLRELAQALEVRTTTAHNLAHTLVDANFLEKVRHPVRYRLGRGVFDLVNAHTQRCWIDRAVEIVRDIGARFPGSIILLIEPSGVDLVVALRLDTTHGNVVERYSGRHELPYATATAICLLAFAHPKDAAWWRQYYPFPEYASRRWTSEAHLDQVLSSIRRNGFAQLSDAGPFRVAAPIFGRDHQTVASLGASLSVEPEANESLRDALRQSVCEGARTLTRPDPPDLKP